MFFFFALQFFFHVFNCSCVLFVLLLFLRRPRAFLLSSLSSLSLSLFQNRVTVAELLVRQTPATHKHAIDADSQFAPASQLDHSCSLPAATAGSVHTMSSRLAPTPTQLTGTPTSSSTRRR